MSRPLINLIQLGDFRIFWHCFSGYARSRIWVAVLLSVAIGSLEGLGMFMLVPLLHALGLGGQGEVSGAARALMDLGGAAAIPLPAILAMLVLVKTFQAILRGLAGTISLTLQEDFVVFLRNRFYGAMAQARWLFLTRQRSSELSEALLTELPSVGATVQQILTLLGVAIVAVAHLTIAVGLSPSMTAFALGSGVAVTVGLRGLRRRSHELGESARATRAEIAAGVADHIAGMKVAKSHGREGQHTSHFERSLARATRELMQFNQVSVLTNLWLEIGAVVALSIFVYFAVSRVNSAQLLVLVFAFTRLLFHSSTLQNLWHQIQFRLPAFAATERLRQQLVDAAEVAPAAVGRIELRDQIRLEHVSFRYDNSLPDSLRDLSLQIPARATTALCGTSGAGKSTLADLLLGLLSPTQGRVRLDDLELEGPTVHAWRRSIGYVPQETFLFHDTIRANLLWAAPDATEDDLRAALRTAAAEQFVARLPHGIDAVVGDRGVRLSGGERQRIALARALLRRPTLLVLDEATSALDVHNERLVQDAIERLHGELTILVIAHRLSTVRMADNIVVLERGTIVETGTWDDLCRRDQGYFRRLVEADTET